MPSQVHQAASTEPRAESLARGLPLFLLLAALISAVLCTYYFATGQAFAFIDIGLDTFSYYYPTQLVQAQQLMDYHTLAWSFRLGLGGYVGAVVHPIQLAFVWLPESWQLGARLPLYLAKLVLAGVFFHLYLRRLRFDPMLACIGALCYTFGNYGAINEQWDSVFIIQTAAYLYFLESHLRTGRAIFAVAAGVTVCAAGAFELYVFTLLTAVYLPVRGLLVDRRMADYRPFLRWVAVYGAWAGLGCLLLAFFQLPNVLYLLDSPRVSGEHSIFASLLDSLFSLNDGRTVAMSVAGIFGKDLLGTNLDYPRFTNYFEAPGFYAGLLMLVCAPQLLAPRASRREKLGFMVGVLALLAYLVWPAMRQAVFGFGHTAFRISTLWVAACIVLAGVAGLRRAQISGVWRPGLVMSIAAILTGLLFVAWRLHEWARPAHAALVLGFAITYTTVLWTMRARLGKGLIVALALLTTFELFVFGSPAWIGRDSVALNGTSGRGSYEDGTGHALGFIRSLERTGDFYRVEKTYESVFLNDALAQGYDGTASYFFHAKSVTRFVDQLQLPRRSPRANYISRMVERPEILALVGVKYLLAKDDRLEYLPHMRYIANVGRVRIYENLAARRPAHPYRELMSESAAAAHQPSERDSLLLQYLVVDNPQPLRSLMAVLDDGPIGSPLPARERVSILKHSDLHLQIDASLPRAAALMVAVPFEPGWTATVDGRTLPLFRAQYGLSALMLPPGIHRVDLRYAVPGRSVGITLSLGAGVVLLLLGLAALARRSRAK